MPTTTPEESKDLKPHEPDRQNGKQQNESPDGKLQKDDQSNKSDSADKSDEKKEEEKKPVDPATKRRRLIIGIAAGIVVVVAGVAWWLYSSTYESTDDAQVNGHINSIASRVDGTIRAV